MTELYISHFNGLKLTYNDLIMNNKTGVYLGEDSQKYAFLPGARCAPNHEYLSCVTTIISERTTPRNTNERQLRLWE